MVESVYPMIQVEQAQEIVLAQAEDWLRCLYGGGRTGPCAS